MCILLLAIDCVEGWPLVLLGNRDEFHARPSMGAQPWMSAADCLGGTDLEAGGSWLMQRNDGRFAAVTNVRSGARATLPRSRGELVRDFVLGNDAPSDFIDALLEQRERYAPFNLVIGERRAIWLIEGIDGRVHRLARGVHAISNGPFNARWPKADSLQTAFGAATARGLPEDERLFALLRDEREADPASLPDTGVGHELERRLSPIFIRDSAYGTRCSTLVLHDGDDGLHVRERLFDAHARVVDDVAWKCTDVESEWVLA